MRSVTHKFSVTDQKWGDDQQRGSSGNLVTFSFATTNFPNQFSEFDNFIIDPDYQDEIVSSFLNWATSGDIQFQLVPDTALVDIRLGWANFDGPGGVLGAATIPSFGPLSATLIKLDETENWKLGNIENNSQIDFSLTVTHEIGHTIGILHSENDTALMHEFYNAEIVSLQQDDIDAVQSLYGPATEQSNVFRFFNTVVGGHFFTTFESEKNSLEEQDEFRNEGVGFNGIDASVSTDENFIPIYRFFNKLTGGHFFTASELERISVLSLVDFTFEGIAFKASDQKTVETQPVYRFFNSKAGGHFFTASEIEKEVVLSQKDFLFEGTAFYAFAETTATNLAYSLPVEDPAVTFNSINSNEYPFYDDGLV